MSSENGVPAESVAKHDGGQFMLKVKVLFKGKYCAIDCPWSYKKKDGTFEFDIGCHLFRGESTTKDPSRCPQCIKEFGE